MIYMYIYIMNNACPINLECVPANVYQTVRQQHAGDTSSNLLINATCCDCPGQNLECPFPRSYIAKNVNIYIYIYIYSTQFYTYISTLFFKRKALPYLPIPSLYSRLMHLSRLICASFRSTLDIFVECKGRIKSFNDLAGEEKYQCLCL